MIKNLPAMQKTWVRSLDQEDALEKALQYSSVFFTSVLEYHFSILA